MKNKLFLSVPLVICSVAISFAQVPDSIRNSTPVPAIQIDTIPTDSLLIASDSTATAPTLPAAADSLAQKKRGVIHRIFKSDYPNPKKALYLSMVFPGGGQIYNRRWWKPPIVWGGYAALIYAVKYNTNRYQRLKVAYLAQLNQELHEFSGLGYDAGDLKRLRDEFDKNKQLSYIGIFALHIVQTAEAFVDCHLKTFDVSDDLSLHLKPALEPSFASQFPVVGVGVSFSFGK